jgi:hypothetical protein
MKVPAAIYLTLGVLGLAAVLLIPLVIYRSGSPALPIWQSLASPGPLSSAHAFLGGRCESCHAPNKPIVAASCMTCHATESLVLGKQSTAFHSTVGNCAGCHIEHRGTAVRPIIIDHSVLTAFGFRAAHSGAVVGQPATSDAAVLRHFLESVTGDASVADTQVLDCASCHAFRDRHKGYFGQQCADCHKTETWKIAGYLHPSPKSQECAQCHQAPPSHYMMHFEMMDRMISGRMDAGVEQCFACHQTDSFNDIKGAGWVKMH